MEVGKRALVFSLTGLVLLIVGSYLAVDWMMWTY